MIGALFFTCICAIGLNWFVMIRVFFFVCFWVVICKLVLLFGVIDGF